MTTEQILMKLAEITGKSKYAEQEQPIIAYGDIGSDNNIEVGEDAPVDATDSEPVRESDDSDGEYVQSDVETEPVRVNSKELIELAMKWGATISSNGFLINNSIEMTRKEYLKYTKNLNVDQVLSDPLLYVLFRSEEQPDANFFTWLDRFPKAKNESNIQK